MRKVLIGMIFLLITVYFLLSPLLNAVEINESSPIKDRMETMSESEKNIFDSEIAKSPSMPEREDRVPSAFKIADGIFKARAHDVSGSAILISEGNNKILRFENFETINGPNLHIYLASSLGDGDYIDLGAIKATKGNVNYDIPMGTDTEKYDKVLVWCVPFGVLFSYAELG